METLPKERKPNVEDLRMSNINPSSLDSMIKKYKIGTLYDEVDPWFYHTMQSKPVISAEPEDKPSPDAVAMVNADVYGGEDVDSNSPPTLSRGYLQYLTSLLPKGSFVHLWFTLQSYNIPVASTLVGLVYTDQLKSQLPFDCSAFVSMRGASTIFEYIKSTTGRSHPSHSPMVQRVLEEYIYAHDVEENTPLYKYDETLKPFIVKYNERIAIDLDGYLKTLPDWPSDLHPNARFGAVTFINAFTHGVLPYILDHYGKATYSRITKKLAVPEGIKPSPHPVDSYGFADNMSVHYLSHTE